MEQPPQPQSDLKGLERLRSLPEDKKKGIALLGASIIVIAIAALWIVSLQQKASFQSTDGNVARSQSQQASPLQVLRDLFDQQGPGELSLPPEPLSFE
jgi:hypothetical protein